MAGRCLEVARRVATKGSGRSSSKGSRPLASARSGSARRAESRRGNTAKSRRRGLGGVGVGLCNDAVGAQAKRIGTVGVAGVVSPAGRELEAGRPVLRYGLRRGANERPASLGPGR